MYKYYLVINIEDEKKQNYNLDLSYKAFDSMDAENIANIITKNLKGFKNYTIYRKDFSLVKHYKKQ